MYIHMSWPGETLGHVNHDIDVTCADCFTANKFRMCALLCAWFITQQTCVVNPIQACTDTYFFTHSDLS